MIPERLPKTMPADLSRHAETLVAQYGLDRELPAHVDVAASLLGRDTGIAEVLIPPRSPLIGQPVFPGMVTTTGELVVLAVQRHGEDIGPGETTLVAGDAVLLHGPWACDRGACGRPARARSSTIPSSCAGRPFLGPGAGRALAILGLMIVALATGIVPSAVAGLVAASALVVTRVLTSEAAYRGISWTTVVLVAGMIPLSTAMTQTGAADLIADALIGVVGGFGPYALLAGLFVVTAVFGQLISNMATALIVIPIALAAAGNGRRRPARADVGHGRGVRGLSHASGHAGEPDGDGPGRLPVRRLLAAGFAAARGDVPGGGVPRSGHLAVLRSRPAPRRTHLVDRPAFRGADGKPDTPRQERHVGSVA